MYKIQPPKKDYRGYAGVKYSRLPFLIAGICAVLALLIKLIFSSMAFAALFLICLAAALFVYGIAGMLAVNSRFFRAVKLIIGILFLLWLVSLAVVELLIIIGMKDDPDTSADYVIVLGAGLHGDTPSLTLSGRLENAAAYLKEHKTAIAIVSGGQGPGEHITEAEAMRRYLVATGIAPERVIMEDKSRSTNENLAFSSDIIRELSGADSDTIRVCIISSDFHLFRSRLLAKRHGLEPVCIGSSLPLSGLQLTYMLREYFSIINALLAQSYPVS